MVTNEIKQKLKQEKNVSFINEIRYNQNTYVKTIRLVQNGIEYVYYEIKDKDIIEIDNTEILMHFKENYEINEGSIHY